MSATALSRPRRELAHRASAGIEVTLFWSPDDNTTTVVVWRPEADEILAFSVPPEHALENFYHPFAHLPIARGRPMRVGSRP